MTVHRASTRLPAGVIVAAVVAVSAGLGAVLSGVWMFTGRADPAAALGLGIPDRQMDVAGVVTVAFGIVLVLSGVGLVRRSRFMRGLFGLITVATVAVGAYVAVTEDTSVRTSSLAGVGIGLIVLYLLFGSARSADWFDAA